jgi:plasmid stability protein
MERAGSLRVLAVSLCVSYIVYMSTTITIRTDESLREALDKKAAASGKTVSELVREILEDALSEKPLQVRTGHLKGRLRLRKASETWRKRLRQANWRT